MNIATNKDRYSSQQVEPALAIICLTEPGAHLALKLQHSFAGRSIVYLPKRLREQLPVTASENNVFFEHWQDTIGEVFRSFSHIVCIMAAGIVVRSMAELLQSKLCDPAVVVMDENGQFAVSLLSGHVGGGNALAKQMASFTDGTAVITTSTDVHGKPAVDMLALELQAAIEPRENVKIVNRMLAEGRQVALVSPYPLWKRYTEGLALITDKDGSDDIDGWVYVTPYRLDRLQLSMEQTAYVHIIPRNIVVGIGCRKGIAYDNVQAALSRVLTEYEIHRKSVKHFVTIDFKAEEPALRELSERWDIPLLTVTKQQIAELDGEYTQSEWVQKTIGVGGVCEPAAKIASHRGITMVPKQSHNGVTISVAMEKSPWWDWDQAIKNT